MKKKPQNFNRRIVGAYLRKSDLRSVAEAWRPIGDGGELQIESENHIFETIDELIACEEPTQQITLTRQRLKSPTLKYEAITLRPDAVTIHIGNASDADVGLGTRIEEMLLKCRKRLRLTQQASLALLSCGIVLALMLSAANTYLTVRGLIGSNVLLMLTAIDFALLGIAVMGLVSFMFRGQFIKFRPERGEKRPIEWRDHIGKVVVGVVVAVITTIVNHLVKKR